MHRLPNQTDLYAVLDVADSATHDEVRAAYRAIMRQTHPDVAGPDRRAVDTAVQANLAWSVLRDPRQRADYDRGRAAARAGSRPRNATEDHAVPSWGPGGIRPATAAQLRDAAARESAYSAAGRQQRLDFSRASMRVGSTILLIGAMLLLVAIST